MIRNQSTADLFYSLRLGSEIVDRLDELLDFFNGGLQQGGRGRKSGEQSLCGFIRSPISGSLGKHGADQDIKRSLLRVPVPGMRPMAFKQNSQYPGSKLFHLTSS